MDAFLLPRIQTIISSESAESPFHATLAWCLGEKFLGPFTSRSRQTSPVRPDGTSSYVMARCKGDARVREASSCPIRLAHRWSDNLIITDFHCSRPNKNAFVVRQSGGVCGEVFFFRRRVRWRIERRDLLGNETIQLSTRLFCINWLSTSILWIGFIYYVVRPTWSWTDLYKFEKKKQLKQKLVYG